MRLPFSVVLVTLVTSALSSWYVSSSDKVNESNHDGSTEIRIIALSPHLVEIVYALGLGDNLVGVSEYSDFPKSALDKERVGDAYSLNVERIITLEPDIILVWKDGTPSQQKAQLKRFKQPVEESSITTPSELISEIKRLGTLLGAEKQAKAIVTKYQSLLPALSRQYENTAPISLFYLLGRQPLMSVTGVAWPNQLLAFCNVDNIIEDELTDYPLVSIEHVISQQPQAIVLPISPENSNGPHTKIPSQLASIPAIKVNADAFHRMSLRSLDALAETCEMLDKHRY